MQIYITASLLKMDIDKGVYHLMMVYASLLCGIHKRKRLHNIHNRCIIMRKCKRNFLMKNTLLPIK